MVDCGLSVPGRNQFVRYELGEDAIQHLPKEKGIASVNRHDILATIFIKSNIDLSYNSSCHPLEWARFLCILVVYLLSSQLKSKQMEYAREYR